MHIILASLYISILLEQKNIKKKFSKNLVTTNKILTICTYTFGFLK